jgi:hypothetical protein
MKRISMMALLALGWSALDTRDVSAGWNNVFQTCCDSCRPARSSFFAPAADPCCPQPQVSYVQRSYYQPYTAYRQETYLQPVTSYYRSYYLEPVTTYKYTSYYDPCTGCCQKVATPCTSYVQRSKCNAVTSYVQRCQMVPYTAYRKSCYMEPVVTYNPCPTCPTSAPVVPGGGPVPGGAPVPGVQEGVAPGASGGQAMPPGPKAGVGEETLPPQNIPGGYNRSYPPTTKEPPLKMDRITNLGSKGQLQGTVVRDDRITPRSGAKVYFASKDKNGAQFTASTDPVGRFAIVLPAGEWTMYVSGTEGKPEYHSVISVKPQDQRLVTVVSR